MEDRINIPEKYKWDLTNYCNSIENCKKIIKNLENTALLLKKYENKLKNKANIVSCLEENEAISIPFGICSVYAYLLQKENADNTDAEELVNYIDNVSTKISTELSFIESEINLLPIKLLKELEEDKSIEKYKLYFKEVIRTKKHALSKKEEKLLSQVSEFSGGFSDVFDMYDNSDIKFEDVVSSKGEKLPFNHSKYSLFMASSDRTLRKSSFESMHNAYKVLNKTLSANYISQVKKDNAFSKIRKFSSRLESALFSEEVSTKIYETLLKGVRNNLSAFHKMFSLKAKTLGVEKFAIYDMYANPCAKIEKKYSFEEAIELIKNATLVLGDDYQNLLDKAVKERWIDVFPNKGKETGAFSWGAYGKNPVVLLNFVNDTNSVFTLAHELGHAMHTYYSNKHQNYINAGYTIFVAEVASNVNELLLLFSLLEKAETNEEKVYYYDQFSSMFRGSVFRQTMFAEFEAFAHMRQQDGGAISSKVLNDEYFKLNKEYFGDEVDVPEIVQYEWSRIPHFYTSFYVYKYATGFISALVLAKKLYDKEDGAREKYIEFLSSGSTLDPVSLLKRAGANLEDEKTFDFAFDYLNDITNHWSKMI